MNIHSFILYIETEDIYIDIPKKMLKLDLTLQIMKQKVHYRKKLEFISLGPTTYSYFFKKGEVAQNYVIKQRLKFEDYKHCSEATPLGNQVNQPEK